jgi:hypothetical protein
MTQLHKTIERETAATVFERSLERLIIVSLEPPGLLGFRLKGTRQTYRLPVQTCFWLAVRAGKEQR